MTKQKIAAIRWALVPISAILGIPAAFVVVSPLNRVIHGIVWSSGNAMPGKPFIFDIVLPFDGALAASLFVLFGSLVAPNRRCLVAFVLLLVGGFLAWAFVGPSIRQLEGTWENWGPLIGTYLGGLVAFLLLFLRFRPGASNYQ